MEAIQLDTHVVAWLWQGEPARIKRIAKRLKGREPLVSPAVILELQLLHEIGRLRHVAEEIMGGLSRTIGLSLCGTPFSEVMQCSLRLSWCRDPFDRLILAQAIAEDCKLLTCDKAILVHYKKALDF